VGVANDNVAEKGRGAVEEEEGEADDGVAEEGRGAVRGGRGSGGR
jgi:hypothetical protein